MCFKVPFTEYLSDINLTNQSRMDPSWEFQAPQFVDFNNLERAEDKKADDFFNVDMESGELWTTALEEAEITDSRKDVSIEDNINNQTVTVMAKHLPPPPSTTSDPTSSSLSLAKTSIQQKTKRLANLVTSWSKESVGQVGSVLSYTSSSSAAKPPLKKRRRMSNAIMQSIALPSQTNNNKLLKLTPKRHKASSIISYKSASPKRLGTNSSEPRLAVNMWKKKAMMMENNTNKTERPQSAPASSSSKFFATVPKPFKLSTEKRAEERKVIDLRRKENEIRQERMRQAELERRRRESEEELIRYRQSLIHKAQPIKQFRKMEIKRSEKMLTLPESPQLTRGTKARSQLKSL